MKVLSRTPKLVEERFTLDMNGRTDKDGFARLLKGKISSESKTRKSGKGQRVVNN